MYYQPAPAVGQNLGQWEIFIIQPFSTGGVFINPQSWAGAPGFSPIQLDNAAAEAHLDGCFPQPPWRMVVKP
jgi:hypothetical protein